MNVTQEEPAPKYDICMHCLLPKVWDGNEEYCDDCLEMRCTKCGDVRDDVIDGMCDECWNKLKK